MPNKDILIVDDSATLRNHLIGILSGAGYKVNSAADGIEALKALKSTKVDLMLLDLQMPKMNGFEVLRMIQNDVDTQNLHILCITGVYDKLEDIHKLKELGAHGYIRKDCTPEDLLFRVERVFSG